MARLCRGDGLIGSRQRLVERALLAVRVGQVVHAIGDARLHAGAMVGSGGDLPRGDGFGVAATEMADDAQIVRGAAGRGVIAVAARGHQGLVQKSAASVRVAAEEGDRAPRVDALTVSTPCSWR